MTIQKLKNNLELKAFSKGILYGCATVGITSLTYLVSKDINIMVGIIIALICIISVCYDFINIQ